MDKEEETKAWHGRDAQDTMDEQVFCMELSLPPPTLCVSVWHGGMSRFNKKRKIRNDDIHVYYGFFSQTISSHYLKSLFYVLFFFYDQSKGESNSATKHTCVYVHTYVYCIHIHYRHTHQLKCGIRKLKMRPYMQGKS